MHVEVNYLAVLLAALSTMVVGSLWYSPALFYKEWAKLGKVKPDPEFTGAKMARTYGLAFLLSLVTAYVLAHVAFLSNNFFRNEFWQDAVTTGFWLWLGFTATRLYMHDLFEQRPFKMTTINAGHELVTVLVMAVIIGVMGY